MARNEPNRAGYLSDLVQAEHRPLLRKADSVPALNNMDLRRCYFEISGCFLRLANLPNFALDRLSRYEATLWRQSRQILLAPDALDRRKPQERARPMMSICEYDDS
jgi:hypothetical protein